jgi:glutathionylspermidine amidase/synthetase
MQQHSENQSRINMSHSLQLPVYQRSCLYKLVVALVITCFSLWGGTISVAAEEPLPGACATQCTTPYGEVLGRSPRNVVAYSNCSSKCVSLDANRLDDVYMGMPWQCVEYARRWLYRTQGLVFESVETAADMWDSINSLVEANAKGRRNLHNLPNGSAESPRRGDLLIWSSGYLGTGHVAIVTRVDHEEGYVEVAEQNFLNQGWPGSYARRIPLQRRKGGVWLDDEFLVGWKRLVE